MILSFSTQLNGKPTYFPEKIIAGLFENEILTFGISCELLEQYVNKVDASLLYNKLHTPVYKGYSKIHTIREDKTSRWKSGMMIDFFINARQKNMFCFAPRIQVTSIQNIEIKFMSIWNSHGLYAKPFVKIDGTIIYDVAGNGKEKMLQLAVNDGFESIDDFFSYFNKDFKGKIIHWTGFKY
ncbi:hypothetical protein DBR39_13655 [Chryseobacterium sp. KBW03]|uniref:hypothetical protein n=1 Tax=Chryseobacterium sp. KBW03 TaxID=2153362 RepID=UPI000F5B401E|nr:hypothetical protein [Chryseobacterium sp. KBW03]RQO37929.1 hypothetical protein DBR39_13655 [Chryseobacterium sp. KBW03]